MTLRTTRMSWMALTVGALQIATTACAGDGADEASCGPITREALDPAYLIHVVGDASDITYTSDPPTSGPHKPGPEVRGALTEPLTRAVQVGVLERGDVLIQHDPALPAAQQRELATLAGREVTVAPNPDLPAAVVATAWTAKRICRGVDVAALAEFVRERANNGPEG